MDDSDRFDQYATSSSSCDYDHISDYIKANGADFKTRSKVEASNYIGKLDSTKVEGGLYAIELEGEYYIIIP